MRTAYNELQVSCRNRESLENSTLEEMERELGRVLKSNEELQGKKEMRRNGVELIARARIFCLLYKQFQTLKHPVRSREFILTLNY